MNLNIIKLDNPYNEYFKKAWEIYQYSFPKEERRTLKEQNIILKNNNYTPKAFIKNNQIVAILFFWKFDESVFIEHFAVNMQFRGESFGSKILSNFVNKYHNVFLEIDPIKDEISKKRFSFYNKLGFVKNNFKHYQVPFRKNSQELELTLLSYKKPLEEKEYNHIYEKMKNSLFI